MGDVAATAPTIPVSTPPRIYVACLAAYNSGELHGRWIDANQSAADINEEVQAMLSASPEPGAEEWAIHDYEGFGGLSLSEWESFENVSAIARGIEEHGPAFGAWLSYDTSYDPSDVASFENAYRGEWDSLRDYADRYAEDIGLHHMADKVGSPYVRVDVDALTRDLDIELYVVNTPEGTVHVFDPDA